MTCNRARRLFGACWDDELTQAEREWLEAHFTACPRCRTEYDGYSRALELAGALPRAEAPADFPDRVLARTRRSAPVPDRVFVRPVRWVPATALAAAGVLVIAGLLLGPRLLQGPAGPGEPGGGLVSRTSPGVPPPQAVLPGMPSGPDAAVVSSRIRMPEHREAARSQMAVVPDSLFDHSEDVEFILDPVAVRRSGASPQRQMLRSPAVQGEQAVITF